MGEHVVGLVQGFLVHGQFAEFVFRESVARGFELRRHGERALDLLDESRIQAARLVGPFAGTGRELRQRRQGREGAGQHGHESQCQETFSFGEHVSSSV